MNSRSKITDEELSKRLKTVAKGIPRVKREKAPDSKDIQESITYANEKLKIDLRNEWLLVGLRERYGTNIIRFLWVYSLFSSLTITASGFGFYSFKLPDLVLTALVGGSAVSVLGVVGTVAAGLFRQPPPK